MAALNDAPVVRVSILREGAAVPGYMSAGAAGADLAARIDGELRIEPLGRALVPTGISIEVPSGFEAQVRPRSGNAIKKGLAVLNSPGTIDSDYRGEVMVILANLGAEPQTIRDGDRIAQLVVAPVSRAAFEVSGPLGESRRGAGGFGSTGA